MIEFLQKYLRINTSHPNPDYEKVLDLFKQEAKKNNFHYQEIILPSKGSVGIITELGSDSTLPALALNQHMDVVPALNIPDWKAHPFAAEIIENCIIGRGAQDMKGVGVAHFFALKKIKDFYKGPPKRTIHLILVPNEEIGGFTGTGELVETDAFKKLNIGFIIDEGLPSGNDQEVYVKISERRPLQITVTAQGKLAHASHLQAPNALYELINFLQRISVLHIIEQKKALTIDPGLLTSYQITSLQAGIVQDKHIALNIIPDKAEATLDIRIGPHNTLHEIQNIIEMLLKEFPTLSYNIEAYVKDQTYCNPVHSALHQAISTASEMHGKKIKNIHFEATTDLRFYHQMGIDGYGVSPFSSKANLHGTNESITLKDLTDAQRIFFNILELFCYKGSS